MDKVSFWKKDAAKISAIIESLDQNLDDSFIWVTNIKEHETWCSEKTKVFFGLPGQIFTGFEEMIKDFAHHKPQSIQHQPFH